MLTLVRVLTSYLSPARFDYLAPDLYVELLRSIAWKWTIRANCRVKGNLEAFIPKSERIG